MPSAAADSYRIDVVVTVGDLDAGHRWYSPSNGDPATIDAGDTYNMACLPHQPWIMKPAISKARSLAR